MLNFVRRSTFVLAVAGLLTATAPPARAWNMASPFSSGSSQSSVKISKKKSAPSKKPGVVGALTSAPKKLYSSTKSMVAPSKKASGQKKKSKTSSAKKASPQSSGQPTGIKSWFTPAPPPPLPSTVSQFMAQKRPEGSLRTP